jgi:hypothetical protein
MPAVEEVGAICLGWLGGAAARADALSAGVEAGVGIGAVAAAAADAEDPRHCAIPGSGASGVPRTASRMKRAQISAGKLPPDILFVGDESSLPSQTPATIWLV